MFCCKSLKWIDQEEGEFCMCLYEKELLVAFIYSGKPSTRDSRGAVYLVDFREWSRRLAKRETRLPESKRGTGELNSI